MPHAGPLRQILRALNVQTLRKIKARHAPQVSKYDGDKGAFVKRLRGSLDRSEEVTFKVLMETIRDILKDDQKQVTTLIKDSLRNLKASKNAGREDVKSKERFISSELFQSLHHNLSNKKKYKVFQEKYSGKNSIDILVKNQETNRKYLIEVKIASNHQNLERLKTQMKKYIREFSYVSYSYVLLICERKNHMPENKESVREIKKEVEEMDVKVMPKGPSDLRYSD